MAVVIAMLRGVNVGGHNKIKMEALRALCESLGLRDARTYVQTGNVVFRTEERDLFRVAQRLEDAMKRSFGFRPGTVVRSASELREAVARNPFATRRGIDPSKLLVTFLARDPGPEAWDKVRRMVTAPQPANTDRRYSEEMRIDGRELYIYFPNGIGQSKLPWARIGEMLETSGTGRNWNTVRKLLEIAERLESAQR